MAGEKVIVGLDVGTTKVCTLIGEVKGEDQVLVVGAAVCPSRGLRKGVVVDMEEATGAIAACLKKAEVFSGYKIIGVYVGVSGAHLDSDLAHSSMSLSGDQPVSRQQVLHLLDAARLKEVPEGRHLLHMIPRGYSVDGDNGVRNPVGMLATRLEMEGLVVTSTVAPLQNLKRCVERTDVKVDGYVSAGLASAEGVLSDMEKQLGVLLLDIGGGHDRSCLVSGRRAGVCWRLACGW
jgi:cell division protein FtsA